MDDLNLPVLIYGAKDGCRACQFYEPEWDRVMNELQGRARFVKLTCRNDLPPPGPLAKYLTWYPSIVLAGPKSYFRCFTPDDNVNEEEFSPSYTIRARKFNANETPAGFRFANNDNTAANTIAWFNQTAPDVPNYDEPMPPRRYAQHFNRR